MIKLLNRLSEELYEVREFINDEDYRIKTLEYEKSKLDIKKISYLINVWLEKRS